jgi:hypothetical protein
MKLKVAILTASIVAHCAATTLSAQVLSNPGFETGALSPWFQGNDYSIGEEWNVTTLSPHSGNFAATNTGNKEIRQNLTAVPTNSIQTISFWASHEDPDLDLLSYDFFYSDGTTNEFYVNPIGSGYKFYDVTGKLSRSKNLVGFSIYGVLGSAPGRTFLDDVTIATIPEPSATMLIGVAAITVFGSSPRAWRLAVRGYDKCIDRCLAGQSVSPFALC